MAKRRSVSELKRQLKRRLRGMDSDAVMRLARELREFALAHRFYGGYSATFIAENDYLARVMGRDDIERAVRNHGGLRR